MYERSNRRPYRHAALHIHALVAFHVGIIVTSIDLMNDYI